MTESPKASSAVFINCPFDEGFRPLLQGILFVTVYLGFTPVLASQRSNSAESRLAKICELIDRSTFSIHDLSRLRPDENAFARMNMPFELGIDYGAREYGPGHKAKVFLVLGQTAHDYKIALSDLSGVDIKSHRGEVFDAVRAVRNWFFETVGLTDIDHPTVIWYAFHEFETDLVDAMMEDLRSSHPFIPPDEARDQAISDFDRMPVAEYIHRIESWVAAR